MEPKVLRNTLARMRWLWLAVSVGIWVLIICRTYEPFRSHLWASLLGGGVFVATAGGLFGLIGLVIKRRYSAKHDGDSPKSLG